MSKVSQGLRIIRPVFFLLILIWIVHGFNVALQYNLNSYFGLYPRRAIGIPGIVTSTFLHGSFPHILANTTPLAALGLITAGVLRSRFWMATFLVIILGGGMLWLFGRPNSVHVGASGLIFGYFGLLICLGIFERSLGAVLGALAAIGLYGGMIWGIFGGANVSWEGHVLGAIAGALTAIIIAKRNS